MPNDVASPPDQPAEAGAVAGELARLCVMLGADSFHLYRIAARKRRLVPVLDAGWPAVHALTHALPDALPNSFAERAATRQCIFWWGKEAYCALPVTSGWMLRLDCSASRAGLAFPLVGAAGGHGTIVFAGRRICGEEEMLMGIHARAHALFDALPEAQPARTAPDLPAVSPRELQCLRLTADGLTSDDIARRLGLSVHTANQYLANVAEKLNAANRVHAVAKALREGLIE